MPLISYQVCVFTFIAIVINNNNNCVRHAEINYIILSINDDKQTSATGKLEYGMRFE